MNARITKGDTEAERRQEMAKLAERDATRRVRANVAVEDIDDLLDEIDSVLEDAAETTELARNFVAEFVQKGGQALLPALALLRYAIDYLEAAG